MTIMRVRSLLAGLTLALLPSAGAVSGQAGCPSGQSLRGHLGVEIGCDCTVSRSPTAERPWTFRSPIRVESVERGGAADGVLREGDLVLAVDGAPVTTPRGARRLAELRPGERVALRV
ncbi:MAG TPA: PDZ domain-containing protein, partial [Longimicrobiaceae bacterium]|nr:PDZ domain-containing protein [Longimicrobiaceae bacterium]